MDKKIINISHLSRMCLLPFAILVFTITLCGNAKAEDSERPKVLNLKDGFQQYKTTTLKLELVNSSQTVAKLMAAACDNFDFTPFEWLEERDADGFYHLGDINLALRSTDSLSWKKYSSAARRHPVEALSLGDTTILAAADLKNTFPDDFPLQLTRIWQRKDDHLVLKFRLKNPTNHAVEIGALGIPLIFNNNFTRKHLDQAHAENVFFDPYIGADAGYLQVVRLNGKGPSLVVLPYGHSPFEAYRPLPDDPTPRGFTFEGFYEWMICSKAYAEKEWKGSSQWNIPTSKILVPGENYEFGLEFVLAGSVEDIENTLIRYDKPMAIGIPGYVLPEDVDASLFLKTNKTITNIQVEPKGALQTRYLSTTKSGWRKYQVKGVQWGRARLTISYGDGSIQTINYKVIKPESEVVADNGRFLMDKQWYVDENDLFGRSPSVMSYDYEAQKLLTQDRRAWVAGLSDEGGAGSWLNAIMKQLVEPDKEEIAKLENFVNQTVVGGIQYDEGLQKYGVRKSMFYYEPDSMPAGTYSDTIDYSSWAAWPKKEAMSVGRSYNYPHVTAACWAMYRLARNHTGLVNQNDWSWYLERAFHTAMAMVKLAPYYAQFGQMEGSVFLFLLNDLKAEGFSGMAAELENAMKARATHWASLNYPFGSEMPWDSTGQEEVYMWSRYFGFSDKSLVTIRAILAYMPTIPHWAYNGNARRYWDFLYGGKLSRIERMIHHYGSPLNAIPVLTEYRDHPENLYLLRVGYGGLMGALSNITEDGFAPCASHSFPSTLRNDGISGDYGSGYYGYAVNSATYITHNDELGWLAFGGNLTEKRAWVETEITTAAKSKVYIAPAKTWITLDAGQIEKVSYNTATGEIKLLLGKADQYTANACLRVEKGGKEMTDLKPFKRDARGIFVIPLKNTPVEIRMEN